MEGINVVTLQHIKSLTDLQLTMLLDKLIKLEVETSSLTDYIIDVPYNITTGDGGEDGKVSWKDALKKTEYLPNKNTLFQIKATNFASGDCEKEILEVQKPSVKSKTKIVNTLKSRISVLADENGAYILFINKAMVKKGKVERITAFREAFKKAKHKNYKSIHIDVYDANKIKDWTNKFAQAIIFVQSANGITRPTSLITWEDWGKRIEANKVPFKSDALLESNLKIVKDNILSQKVIRVIGHSGLGKTRFVYEAFKGSALKDLVIYQNLWGSENITNLEAFIMSHQESKTAIIVADNCTYKTHIQLSTTIKSTGQFKLITIGFDDNRDLQDIKIKFEKNRQRDIVREIIKDQLTGHNDKEIDYVAKVCEGYPWMAVRFCSAIKEKGIIDVHEIPLQKFTEDLIFGRSPFNEQEFNIIKGCSVFSAFGFYDDSFKDIISPVIRQTLEDQMEYIRTKVIDDSITPTKFKATCRKFLEEDIIEQRGKYYIVKPTILAVNLAAQWLIETPEKKIIEIIQELKSKQLEKQFLERFKELNELDKAKDIVSELWGDKGPFQSAEVLKSEWGSLLFRYVVEVNPQITLKAIKKAFGNYSKEEVENIVEGRRNLIWALEKLCFRKETFVEAAKILYLFAVGENETIGNNSLNQFRQLFHIYLPGTAANLKDRVKIIKWGLEKSDDDYTRIALEALGSAFNVDHFTRMGGAEQQGGGKPLEDYIPSQFEIIEYWSDLIPYLLNIALSENSNSELAKEHIANIIRPVSGAGLFNLLKGPLDQIIVKHGKFWPTALNSLKMTLSYEDYLSGEVKNEIQQLVKTLSPTDIKSLINLTISNPEWEEFNKGENGEYVDVQKIKTEKLAEKIIAEQIDITSYLPDILKGNQIQAFNFGRKLALLNTTDKKLLEASIIEIQKIDEHIQNSLFISGLLYGYGDDKLIESVIDEFLKKKKCLNQVVNIVACYGLTLSLFKKLSKALKKSIISLEQMKILQNGGALNKLTPTELRLIVEEISSFGKIGKWVSLGYIFMYSYAHEIHKSDLLNDIKSLIVSENLLAIDRNYRVDGYHWSESVRQILRLEIDIKFAKTVTNQIVESCKHEYFSYSLDSYIKNTLNELFNNYFKEIWSIIGKGLGGEYVVFMHLESLIGTRNGNSTATLGIAFNTKEKCDVIYHWCLNQPLKTIERIAHMMPLTDKNGGKHWHPFSLKIIENFGNNPTVLSNIISNMGTYGTVGSRVPYFITQQTLFKELLNHSNDNIKDWATENFDIMTKAIKAEKFNDQEFFL